MQNTSVTKQPKFRIGDSIIVDLDDKYVLCKIGFYPNGKVAEYSEDLSDAFVYSYSHIYRLESDTTRYN